MDEIKSEKVIVLKSLKDKKAKEFYETWWFRAISWLQRFLVRNVPPLRCYIGNTANGMQWRAYCGLKEMKYEEAFSICTEGLLRFRNCTGPFAHYNWWEFIRYAALAADKLDNGEKKAQLVLVAENGFPPFKGDGVAPSFCLFARWKGAEGDYEGAIEYARRAKQATETHAEAHALLGWYSLFVDESEAVEHFRNAIRYDGRYLHLITNEPVVREYPSIIKELRKLSVVRDERKPQERVTDQRKENVP